MNIENLNGHFAYAWDHAGGICTKFLGEQIKFTIQESGFKKASDLQSFLANNSSIIEFELSDEPNAPIFLILGHEEIGKIAQLVAHADPGEESDPEVVESASLIFSRHLIQAISYGLYRSSKTDIAIGRPTLRDEARVGEAVASKNEIYFCETNYELAGQIGKIGLIFMGDVLEEVSQAAVQ